MVWLLNKCVKLLLLATSRFFYMSKLLIRRNAAVM